MAANDGRGKGSGGGFLNTNLFTADYEDPHGRGLDPSILKVPCVMWLFVAADVIFGIIAYPCIIASKLKTVAKSRKKGRKLHEEAERFKLDHNQGLCDRCRGITIAKLRQGIDHSSGSTTLLESSRRCPLCRLIASSLPSTSQATSDEKISITLYDKDRVEVSIRGASSLRIWSLPDSVAHSIAPPRLLRTVNNLPADFELALSWLERCIKNHPYCQTESNSLIAVSYKQPHRLIDVSVSESPRLVEALPETNISWVALSHCWGTVPLLRTLMDNIESFKTAISWAQLPRTFQDAMVTTRALGLQYIWIDSLCIIQDSASDWSKESALMPGIYSNATLTIEADSTPSILNGLFTPRENPEEGVRLDIDIDGRQGEIYFGKKVEEVNDSSFLAGRAWCLQERVLSRRILTFQESHMSWTCSVSSHNDEAVLPKGVLETHNYNSFLHTLQSVLDASPGGREAATREANNAWYQLLSGYTRRSLTKPGDKLVAMSGIAEVMASATKDHYLVGLWRKSLPGSLLWMPEISKTKVASKGAPGSERSAKLPETYRAPSWSWASLDGAIDFPSPNTRFTTGTELPTSPICIILDAQTELVSLAAVFGQVNSGFVRLIAPFKEIKWDRLNSIRRVDYAYCTKLYYDIREPEPEIHIYAIHVLFDRGLLLVETEKKDVFRRVGVLVVFEEDDEYGTPNVFDGCEKREFVLI